jgi:hypothetical protein
LKKIVQGTNGYRNDDCFIDLQRVNAQLIDFSLTFNDQTSTRLAQNQHHQNNEQNHHEPKPAFWRRCESCRTDLSMAAACKCN